MSFKEKLSHKVEQDPATNYRVPMMICMVGFAAGLAIIIFSVILKYTTVIGAFWRAGFLSSTFMGMTYLLPLQTLALLKREELTTRQQRSLDGLSKASSRVSFRCIVTPLIGLVYGLLTAASTLVLLDSFQSFFPDSSLALLAFIFSALLVGVLGQFLALVTLLKASKIAQNGVGLLELSSPRGDFTE